jgi:TolA-binding protein
MNVVGKMLSLTAVVGVGLVGLLVYGSEVDEANRLFVLEKYDEAISIYESASSSEGSTQAEEALFGMGRAYQMLGRWKPAKESFEKLLRADPSSELVPGSRIQIGQCEIKLGNPQGALLIFEDIEKRYPGEQASIEATYNISNLKAGFFGNDVKNAREAIEGYQQVLASPHSDRYAVQSHFGLGQCYMFLQDYPRAMTEFQAVLKEGPDTVWASYAAGQIVRAMRAYGEGRSLEMLKRQQELWADLQNGLWRPFSQQGSFTWRPSATRPMLRIHAVSLETAVYVTPTIRYKNYVFKCERGTVDRARSLVNCVGNVECTDGLVPPNLTVTSGLLTLDTENNRAIFSRDVQLEKRSDDGQVQKVVVGELHLLLDSGTIEIPASK